MQWLRLYLTVPDDPKVQGLSDRDFRHWINLLCLAGRDKGRLPPIQDIAFTLRIKQNEVVQILRRMEDRGLFREEADEHGIVAVRPNNWQNRQYKSDTSAERMRRLRERKRDSE